MSDDLIPTPYYDEFKRYFGMAKRQQDASNTGTVPHVESGEDDLMRHVQLYDVVERKLAGFSQLVNDCYYGWSKDHPYWHQMDAGVHTPQRERMAKSWDGKRSVFSLSDWLYLLILHRVTGSAINYGTMPSGYHNTIIWDLADCADTADMVEVVRTYKGPMYTSIGYQFPAFPKPPPEFKRGGDHFLVNYAPRLAQEVAMHLSNRDKPLTFREVGEFMFDWNKANGLRAYRFQYAAFVADIADWFPELIDRESKFYYGTNAVECISYLATTKKRMKREVFLDEVMEMIRHDLDSLPYNAEDVCCDFIRWVENYIRPGDHYEHLDRDQIWSSCRIADHPRGRQRAMLDLGMVDSFNSLPFHPSDLKVLEANDMSVDEYKRKVQEGLSQR